MFSEIGALFDYIFSNPLQNAVTIIDGLNELTRSVELTGSEYIDWKTGGMHNSDRQDSDNR